ncbi:MAG: hypothetical protein ACYCUW_06665, partial [bacterium]
LSFLKRYQIINMRIMQQLIMVLNDFKFIESLKNIDNKVKSIFIQKLITLSFVKFKFNFTDFKEIESYGYSKMTQDIIEGKDNKFKEIIPYLDDLNLLSHFMIDNIIISIIEYLKNPIPNENFIKKILEEENKKQENYEKHDEFDSYFNKIYFDLNYGFDKFKEETEEFLIKNKTNILKIFDMATLNSYISGCIRLCKDYKAQIENEEFYENYFGEIFENYVDNLMKDEFKIYNLDETSINNSLANYSDSLKHRIANYIVTKKKGAFKNFNYDSKKLMNIMQEIQRKNGWGHKEEDLLNNIPADVLKDFILKNANFLRALIEFCKFGKISKRFDQFIKTTNEVIEEIGNIKKEYKIKLLNLPLI